MKKTILLALLMLPVWTMAETVEERALNKHEIGIGWGDMMYEKLMFHPSGDGMNNATCNYSYTGHIFAEYTYRYNHWFSFGGQLDYDQTTWHMRKDPNGPAHYYANFCIMPTLRFTMLNREWVSLYSEFFCGVNVNTGTEVDFKKRTTACSFDMGGTILACSVGKGHWFGSAQFGCLCAMTNMNEVYKICARILSVQVGYRF